MNTVPTTTLQNILSLAQTAAQARAKGLFAFSGALAKIGRIRQVVCSVLVLSAFAVSGLSSTAMASCPHKVKGRIVTGIFYRTKIIEDYIKISVDRVLRESPLTLSTIDYVVIKTRNATIPFNFDISFQEAKFREGAVCKKMRFVSVAGYLFRRPGSVVDEGISIGRAPYSDFVTLPLAPILY